MIDEKLIEEWKAMPRNNKEELARADEYFDKILMPLAAKEFVAKEGTLAQNKYYGMILTLGTSWQPLALSILALRPSRVLLLGTAETMPLVAKLVEFTGLEPDSYTVEAVDRSEVEPIYAAVQKAMTRWQGKGPVCMDITGGTKAMASGAAMLGAVLGLDIYYVESKYLPLYRRPEPGSEYLKRLANPKICK